MDLREYVHQAGVKVAQDALGAIESGQVRTRDELDEFVARGLGQSASDIAAMFTGTSSPMVQSLMASMQPTIMQALQDYTPTFAAVSGGMLALSILLGIYISQETYRTKGRLWR